MGHEDAVKRVWHSLRKC